MVLLRTYLLTASLFFVSGCVTSNEYMTLKNEVNQLKRDFYANNREIALIKKDIDVIKGASTRSVGKESFDAIRESQEQINTQLLTLTKDLQVLQGRFDENKFFVEKSLKDGALELDVLRTDLSRIEKDFMGLKAGLSELAMNRSKPVVKEEKEGKRPESSKEAKESYKASYELFKKGDYKEARNGFIEFLKEHPDHDLSDNAQFWIGETYYHENEHADAILAYEKVIKKFPKSPKIPSALLKQAASFEAMGDKKTAKVIYQLIIQNHAGSPEAKKASAALKSKKKK